jgi:adenylate cyclase class IV
MKFTEIEHKFLLDSNFSETNFFSSIDRLSPTSEKKLDVRDCYYVLDDKTYIYRHRFDREIQQLTVKSVSIDSEIRTEINIPIDQTAGDQSEAIGHFMESFGPIWSCTIQKSINVYYFDDCEIVYYRAVGGGRNVACIEIEARHPLTSADGLRVISKYELELGLDAKTREKRSLIELLHFDQMPKKIQAMFKK